MEKYKMSKRVHNKRFCIRIYLSKFIRNQESIVKFRLSFVPGGSVRLVLGYIIIRYIQVAWQLYTIYVNTNYAFTIRTIPNHTGSYLGFTRSVSIESQLGLCKLYLNSAHRSKLGFTVKHLTLHYRVSNLARPGEEATPRLVL